ncbi:hypothetical protein M413DRAFT_73484 [Hebeloma cylindrosporum]|uniref:Zn(2)-C6 fungal-type domain-containing protein n=1 Tax=Hebeloma cylindrosporum TaxID=76867 RepID=A0A0C2YG26_HEBCY|nr:hypothetical protein M413DRAFT_73484 [Hebeloma cylindrosporum h7]
MANKPLEPTSQNTLQRGKACLRCRKRKMRCDGTKPSCQQCTRAKKADGCEYDDGKGKTRTQILRETIVKLEQRVKELEDPEYISPSVTLFDPHFHSRSNSSSSSFGSPESSYLSTSHSPFPSGKQVASVFPCFHVLTSRKGMPSPASFIPEVFFDEPQTHLQPPIELAQMLLDIFAPHGRQCGLELHMGRLRDSLSLPLSEQRHPVLMNAIYLWACFISRPEPLSQHEDHYLQHALDALPEALRSNDRVIDVIQASCLLSLYFLANGRLLEGSYHVSAAASLSVQTGLGGRPSLNTQAWSCDSMDSDMKPTLSDILDGERNLAFWQVYNLDRCWSVVLRKPCVIPDKPGTRHSVCCPWPQEIKDYEKGHVDAHSSSPTIRAFLSGSVSANSFSVPAIRAKASALFSHAEYLANSWSSNGKPPPRLHEEMRTLEHTITLFLSTLVPIDQLDAVLPEERHSLVTAYTLAHSATIHLHRRFALEDSASFDQSSRAARACIAVIKYISERDFAFLEPIIGPCWWTAADTVIRDLDALEASWPLVDHTELRNDLGVLLYAMNHLSTRFPIVGKF